MPETWCFRTVLLLTHISLHPKTLIFDLAPIRTGEGQLVCNILPHRNLSRFQQYLFQQYLMTVAPLLSHILSSHCYKRDLKKEPIIGMEKIDSFAKSRACSVIVRS